jgi:nucleotide-binding universal stress UspA family protein
MYVLIGETGHQAVSPLYGILGSFIGSISEHVLTHVPCSVLIVREPERP